MKEYWEILRELREDHDLKQSEIASALQIKRQVYSRYETGLNEMPIHHLKAICQFYQVSADYILGLSPVQTINVVGPDPRDRPIDKSGASKQK